MIESYPTSENKRVMFVIQIKSPKKKQLKNMGSNGMLISIYQSRSSTWNVCRCPFKSFENIKVV